jgi:hypothetical protein
MKRNIIVASQEIIFRILTVIGVSINNRNTVLQDYFLHLMCNTEALLFE